MVTDQKLVHLIILISLSFLAAYLRPELLPRDDSIRVFKFFFVIQPQLN